MVHTDDPLAPYLVAVSPQGVKQDLTPCEQCGTGMNPVAVMLGPVCGDCCRANHRRVMGITTPRRKRR